MVILLEIIHIFLEVAQAVFHRMGIFAVNYGVVGIDICRHGLVVRREDVGHIIVERSFDFFLVPELIDNALYGIHSGNEIGFGKVKVALIVDGP